MLDLDTWAQRHGVSHAARIELATLLAGPAPGVTLDPKSEAGVQQAIRLRAPQLGGQLYRNNVGVLPNQVGVPIRFGLANDSPELQKRVKSSDIIGWLPYCLPDNTLRAVFVAIECKRATWHYTGTKREVAQLAFLNIIRTGGGIAGFCRSVTEFEELVR